MRNRKIMDSRRAGLFHSLLFPHFKGITEPGYLVEMPFLIAGAIGALLGGPFADRFGGRNGLLISMIISLIAIYPFLHLNGSWILSWLLLSVLH